MLRRATPAWREKCGFAASRPPSARRRALVSQRARCQAARSRRAAWTKYGARDLGSEVAEWRSEASRLGPDHERSALATTAFRHALAPACQRARPCGQASWSFRQRWITRAARNHCVLGKTFGRRAQSHVFCSVFVEDAKSSRNEVNEFNFSCRRRLPQDVCAQQRNGAARARLPKKRMVWRRGRGAPAGKAPPRKWLAKSVLGAAREQVVGKRAT